MLVIHPDECIDCGVCEPECPADAIKPDTEPDAAEWVEFNRKYSEQWPNITIEETHCRMQKKWMVRQKKFEKFFSEKPGEGD